MEMIANLRSFDVKQILVVNEKNLKNIYQLMLEH